MAVSAARTSPSAPIRSDATMSFNSALVGMPFSTMDSNRFVATKIGFPIALAMDSIRIWKKGIFSKGTARERSPLSMRASSVSARIADRLRRADSLSNFDMTTASGPASDRNSRTSSGAFAKERA